MNTLDERKEHTKTSSQIDTNLRITRHWEIHSDTLLLKGLSESVLIPNMQIYQSHVETLGVTYLFRHHVSSHSLPTERFRQEILSRWRNRRPIFTYILNIFTISTNIIYDKTRSSFYLFETIFGILSSLKFV